MKKTNKTGKSKKNAGGSVQVPMKQYKELVSRPKQKTLNRDTRQGKLRKGKRGNPYTQTLLDPVNVTGVKVPDVTSFPTSTFQVYDRLDVTVGNPFGFAFQPVLADYDCLCTNLNGATAWNNWSPQDDYTIFQPLYHSYRPVSGCLRVWTNASATDNGGELAVAYAAPNQVLTAAKMGTFDQIAKKYKAWRAPLKMGAEVLWMPLDPHSRVFQNSDQGSTDQMIDGFWPGIVLGITGATAGTVVTIETIFNYEAIPEESTLNFASASMPYISSFDSEEATGLMAQLGSLARPFGEDLGSWLLDQGAVVASEMSRHVVGAGIHYMGSQLGRFGRPRDVSILG